MPRVGLRRLTLALALSCSVYDASDLPEPVTVPPSSGGTAPESGGQGGDIISSNGGFSFGGGGAPSESGGAVSGSGATLQGGEGDVGPTGGTDSTDAGTDAGGVGESGGTGDAGDPGLAGGEGGVVETGGAASTGGMVATGGASGMGGSSGGTAGAPTGGTSSGGSPLGGSSGGGGTPACAPPDDPETCGGLTAPDTLIDFATYANGDWGSGSLTGGTAATGNAFTIATTANGIKITGDLPQSSYSGYVFWFGPCVDASSHAGGLSLRLGGSLGGAQLRVRVQTHETYPVDAANSRGGCLFTDCDTRWSECVGPTAMVTVPSSVSTVTVPWSSFSGGTTPQASGLGVETEGLLGIELQLEGCTSGSGCTVNLTVERVALP